jgi:hypothetical protein
MEIVRKSLALAVKAGKVPENNNCVAILETQWRGHCRRV